LLFSALLPDRWLDPEGLFQPASRRTATLITLSARRKKIFGTAAIRVTQNTSLPRSEAYLRLSIRCRLLLQMNHAEPPAKPR
jgi:hypothetical protein